VKRLNPNRWSELWQTATHTTPPADSYARLVAMYSEPHRHYHSLRHIEECLSEFDAVRHLAREPVAVELAIWFHDAVYYPHAADNEERSAELASDGLKHSNAPDDLVNAVQQLVLATKSHDVTLNPDAPLLVDMDLSILGQPPERFWEYEEQIREEYSWVEQTHFAAKRSEILERFLARRRIYNTALFFDRFEVQARENLRASIQKLRSSRHS